MGLLVAGLVPALGYIAYILWLLNRNYRTARAARVPLVICPYDPDNVRKLVPAISSTAFRISQH